MAIEQFYLTDKGQNLLAKGQIGTEIVYTKAAIGDGDVPQGTSITAMTALANKLKDLNITGYSVNGKNATIKIAFSNQGLAPFLWKEIGLYATDPDEGEILYAYGNAGSKADNIPGTLTEFSFNMVTQIGNASSVTVVIDDSLVYVTKKEFEERISSIEESISGDKVIYNAAAAKSDSVIGITTTETLPETCVIIFTAPSDFSAGDTYTLNGSPITLTDICGKTVRTGWISGSPVMFNIAGSNAFLVGAAESTPDVTKITLTASGWQWQETGEYSQVVTLAGLKADEKVDFDADIATLNLIGADIVPVNADGVLTAVTNYPPEVDIQVQVTVNRVKVSDTIINSQSDSNSISGIVGGYI